MSTTRLDPARLQAFSTTLLTRCGLDADKAAVVAEVLLEGDLLGHDTHGLALLAPYLAEIESGAMTRTGSPRVVADYPAAVTWDGQRLPGPWLTVRALDLAMQRAEQCGTATVVVRRSHHIACLAAYLQRATHRGLMVVITCSDPNTASVAPHGGRQAVFTPNPLAAGWPTEGDPVLIDVSMSITTNALTKRLHTQGRRFPGPWALSANGTATDDPAALFTEPAGALLPLGGLDHGHKGYALGLLVEALTGGLAGWGRADDREGWSATVCIQVFTPACFGGERDFRRQTERVAQLCRNNLPRRAGEPVRLPGERALRRRAEQLEHGVELNPSILPALRPWAEKLDAEPPA